MSVAFTIIEEIIFRAQNGMSKPFCIRCVDKNCYYVKSSKMIGYQALCSELISALIAKDWGLPIPDFKLIKLSEPLVRYSAIEGINDLGSDLAWGVAEIKNTMEYTNFFRKKLDDDLCRKILLFDWFIHNEDRKDGNSNLLWNVTEQSLFVIDHNNAFDKSFNRVNFWSQHIFRDDQKSLRTKENIQACNTLLKRTAEKLNQYLQEIPDEWNLDGIVDNYQKDVLEILNRPIKEPDDFWRE